MDFTEYVIGSEKYRYMMNKPPAKINKKVYYATHNRLSGEEMRDIIESLENEKKVPVRVHDMDGERDAKGYIDEVMCYVIEEGE